MINPMSGFAITFKLYRYNFSSEEMKTEIKDN